MGFKICNASIKIYLMSLQSKGKTTSQCKIINTLSHSEGNIFVSNWKFMQKEQSQIWTFQRFSMACSVSS